jgi:4-amino-4-deoxy-L-arabinose transferase-like glycosyltransferase
MPVFYWLESGLIRAGFSAFHAGRWISMAALLGLIVLSGKLVWLYTGDRNAAWVASLATASSSLLASWGTVGQVDTLAVFFALAAFYQYSRFHVRGEPALWIAGACAALAIFTKQTTVAVPAAIFFCLLTRDRKKALWFAGLFGAGVAAAVLAVNAALDGRFLANTVFANLNPFSAEKFLNQFRYFASVSVGMLAIVAVSVSRMLRGKALALCIYMFLSVMVFLGTSAKVGSDTNYQIEATLLLAVCTALGLHEMDFFRLYFGRSKSWITLLLLPLAVHVAMGYRISANVLLARLANEKVFRAEIEQLRPLIPPTGGLVLSTDFNAMVRLRQRMDVEPLIYNLLATAGVIDPEPVRRDLASGAFSTVILSQDVFSAEAVTDREIGTLPAKQLEEVRRHYRLAQHIPGPFLDGVYVYRPVLRETL